MPRPLPCCAVQARTSWPSVLQELERTLSKPSPFNRGRELRSCINRAFTSLNDPNAPYRFGPTSSGRLVSNCQPDAILDAATVESMGTRWVNASATDILGLASDLRVREAVASTYKRLGASPSEPTLDALLALFSSSKRSVTWVAELPTYLMGEGRLIVEADPGCRIAGAVPVDSPEAVPRSLRGISGIFLEGVHPLRGSLPPIPRYVEVAERLKIPLFVCDNLGVGVLGRNGLGVCDHFGVNLLPGIGTLALGHAIPGSGWIVFGPGEMVKALRSLEPAPPGFQAVAAVRSLEILDAEPQRRTRVFDLAERLLHLLSELDLDTGPCVTPWIPVWLGAEEHCETWLRALAENAIAATALLAPGSSRLLLRLPATLSDEAWELFERAFRKVARRAPIPTKENAFRKVELARPGTFLASASEFDARWATGDARSQAHSDSEEASARERVLTALETWTWRGANASSRTIRRATEALRNTSLFTNRKKD